MAQASLGILSHRAAQVDQRYPSGQPDLGDLEDHQDPKREEMGVRT